MNTLVENCEIEHQIGAMKLTFSKKYVGCDKYIGKAVQTIAINDEGFRAISMIGAFYCSESDIQKSVYAFDGEYKFERDGKQYTYNGKTERMSLHVGKLSRDDIPSITFTGCFSLIKPLTGKLRLFEHEMYIKKYNGKSYAEIFDNIEIAMDLSEIIYLGPELFSLPDNEKLCNFSAHFHRGSSKLDKDGNIIIENGKIVRISDDSIELKTSGISKFMSAALQKMLTI